MINVTTAVASATGGALPSSIMDTGVMRVLAAFVAINTLMYCALAVAKLLPRVHPSTWLWGDNRRVSHRSIHPPDSPAERSTARPAERSSSWT